MWPHRSPPSSVPPPALVSQMPCRLLPLVPPLSLLRGLRSPLQTCCPWVRRFGTSFAAGLGRFVRPVGAQSRLGLRRQPIGCVGVSEGRSRWREETLTVSLGCWIFGVTPTQSKDRRVLGMGMRHSVLTGRPWWSLRVIVFETDRCSSCLVASSLLDGRWGRRKEVEAQNQRQLEA